jgi:DNA-binding NarL/FixJ family response regulator
MGSASGPDQIRVAIADERRLIADALAALIDARDEFSVTGVTSDGRALGAIAKQRPAVILIGVGSGSEGAFALVRQLRPRLPDRRAQPHGGDTDARQAVVTVTVRPRLRSCGSG